MSLKNQHIVIIGGSTGIGFATTQMALEQGAKKWSKTPKEELAVTED